MRPPFILLCVAGAFAAGVATGFHWQLADSASRPGAASSEPTAKLAKRPASSEGESRTASENDHSANAQNKHEPTDRFAANRERIQEWTHNALQLDDLKLREQAIEQIREAMGSSDPDMMLAGFSAFQGLYELDFDKASYRKQIEPQLQAKDDDIRAAAWAALMISGLQPEDSALMRQVAKTTGMGERTSYYLFRMEKGDLTGESGEIVRELLDLKNPQGTRSVMQGTWGASYSPALESDLITLSREPATQHDAIYFALSTQTNKSSATIDRLIEVLADPDGNDSGRAAWGLGSGVPADQATRVADAAVKLVSSRTTGYTTERSWGLIENYAGPDQAEALQALADKPGQSQQSRERIQRILDRIASSRQQ